MPHPMIEKHSQLSTGFKHEIVSLFAYQRYLARGSIHGKDVEDWLESEKLYDWMYGINQVYGTEQPLELTILWDKHKM